MEQEPTQYQEITMELLSPIEKSAIDITPDKIFKTLFNSILENGRMPAYFVLFYMTDEGISSMRYDGPKVLAALDYIDHLIAIGKVADPYE